ncbi:MAG TPA: hypothetical protein VH583_05800 [Vicinamibacterales bacterium]
MRRLVSAVVLLMAVVAVQAPSLSAAQTPHPHPGAPPHVLNIVHVRLKTQTSSAYASIESQIARAYERARIRLHWICLQSSKDLNDIVYLNLYESPEDADRATAVYKDKVEPSRELSALQQKLTELTASSTSMLTTRRDDVDRPPMDADFATLRTMRLTTFDVRPGHEGEFIKAIRTATPKDGTWLVYEANKSSTFLLITLKKASITRKDGPPIPKALRHARDAYIKADSRVYTVRPSMSHVTQAFITANPQLWKPAPTPTMH